MSSVSEPAQADPATPALTRESVRQTIHDTLVSQFEVDPGTITPEAKLSETLDLDSLALIEFRQILEGIYNVQLGSDRSAKVQTVGDLSELILAHAPAPLAGSAG
jgi:acyl carrier protein